MFPATSIVETAAFFPAKLCYPCIGRLVQRLAGMIRRRLGLLPGQGAELLLVRCHHLLVIG